MKLPPPHLSMLAAIIVFPSHRLAPFDLLCVQVQLNYKKFVFQVFQGMKFSCIIDYILGILITTFLFKHFVS